MRPAIPTLEIGFNPSGASDAGKRGRAVMVVDVIDASTTAEAALAAGALAVLGASPAGLTSLPVPLDPAGVGRRAGELAKANNTAVIIAAEPRAAGEDERTAACAPVLEGIAKAGAVVEAILPNLGMETARLAELKGRVLVIVSASGGVVYDTALASGAGTVGWATVARTVNRTGWTSAEAGAERAVSLGRLAGHRLSVIASSSNAPEDLQGAVEIARLVITSGFLKLPSESSGEIIHNISP